MTRTVRRLYWLIIGLALSLTLPYLAWGASLSLGGGQVNPHSYSGTYGLDKGWQFSASAEDLYWENDVWSMNVGILYVASHYKRRSNYNGERRSSEESHLAALYASPRWKLTMLSKHLKDISPLLLTGIGVNFTDDTHAAIILGGGFNYDISEAWSLEGKFLWVWDVVKVYRMPSLSIRYEF